MIANFLSLSLRAFSSFSLALSFDYRAGVCVADAWERWTFLCDVRIHTLLRRLIESLLLIRCQVNKQRVLIYANVWDDFFFNFYLWRNKLMCFFNWVRNLHWWRIFSLKCCRNRYNCSATDCVFLHFICFVSVKTQVRFFFSSIIYLPFITDLSDTLFGKTFPKVMQHRHKSHTLHKMSSIASIKMFASI